MASPPPPNAYEIHEACQQGKIKKVKELVKDQNTSSLVNVGAGVFGYTPLHEATSSRNSQLVELLINKGADVNGKSNGDYTPLHIAASIGDIKCIEVLLRYNASVTLLDEFGKTPHRTAVLNWKKKASRVLKTAEVKDAVQKNNRQLGKMIQSLQCGRDVTDTCFNECLEIAVEHNNHFAAGFIILRSPDNITECLKKAMQSRENPEVSAMLLLCVAAQYGDIDLLGVLCRPDYVHQMEGTYDRSIQSDCLPQKVLYSEVLEELREAVKKIDHAFPVSLACNKERFPAARCLLFNIYCCEPKLEADWHGLAIPLLKPEWIENLKTYKKLFFSWNSLTVLPNNMACLNNLLRLDLQHNSLQAIPGCLLQLPLLRNLNISHNMIQSLPVVDRWTSSLNILDIQGNFLYTFPECVDGATIQYLNLADNRLVKIPNGLCKLKSLTSLDIGGNKEIHDLPMQLGKLSKLVDLSLKGLQITDPPLHLQKNTRTLMQFLKAQLRSAEPYYTMKLILIGRANHGKTTLVHRLKGDDAFNNNLSTQGIDIHKIEIRKKIFNPPPAFIFRVWDFAGQEDYYATHQCFLSARSLYLLIWDLTDGERGVWALKPWLDNLVMRVPGCTVIIVGTKLDMVREDNLQTYQQWIAGKIEELKASESRYSKININIIASLAVSCDTRFKDYKNIMENLRMLIYDVADQMTHGKQGIKVMGEQIPLSYKYLERLLDEQQKTKLRNKKIPILNREEFLKIATNVKCPRDILEEDDIEVATKFLHNIGTILHYNDPNQDLKDLYFISPSWLCQLMAKIITVKAAHNFFKNGILETKCIKLIIGDVEEFPPKFYEKYMRLLYRFQIACEVDHHRILVPSKLPDEKPDVDENVDSRDLLTRYHLFTCIPYGFWSRFMSRVLLLMSEMLSTSYSSYSHTPSEMKSPASNFGNDNPEVKDEEEQLEEEVDNSRSLSSVTTSCKEYDDETEEPKTPTINANHAAGIVYVNANGPKEKFLVRSSSIQMFASNESSNTTTSSPDVKYDDKIHNDRTWSPQSLGYNSDQENFSSMEQNSAPTTNELDSNFYSDVMSPSENVDSVNNSSPYVLENGDDRSCENKQDESDEANSSSEKPSGEEPTDEVAEKKIKEEHEASKLNQLIYGHVNNETISESDDSSDSFECRHGSVDSHQSNLPHRVLESCMAEDFVAKESIPSLSSNEQDEDEEAFKDCVDLAYLLDRKYLQCWKNGIVFNHPDLYFSVQQIPSIRAKRETIETKVSNKPLGYRVLGVIVDHIRTLVKEWYPGLAGNDGQNPFVMQCIACPVCIKMGIKPPHLFDIQTAFYRVYNSSGSDYCIPCVRSHCPQVVNVEDICPELVFSDLPGNLQINRSELSYIKEEDYLLGVGAYGKVYRGAYKDIPAAVKLYKFDEANLSTALDGFHDVRQEIFMLSKLRNHPYIVKFLGFTMQPHLCAVMELADHGTIKDALYEGKVQIPRILLFRIAQQLASGLDFLHSRNIVHRDIKSDNILLFSLEHDADVNVKLTDFGTANFISPCGMKHVIGTVGFMAPEMFDYNSSSDEYTCKVDVYSLAMVFYEMITSRRPFHDLLNGYDITDALKNGSRPIYCDILRSFFGLISLTELMIKMWNQECMRRASAGQVLHQLRNTAFQLLYGKRALEDPQNPRYMCYVPNTKELWIVCDDRKGAFVSVIDMATSKVKDVLTIDGNKYGLPVFNLVHICLVDDAQVVIVLRGSHDVLLTFSTEKQRKILNYHAYLEEHVTAIIANDNHVFIGFQHGRFVRILKKHFLKGKMKKDPFEVTINDHRPIPAMVVNDSKLIVANDKYLYLYTSDVSSDRYLQLKRTHQLQPVREIILSKDKQALFVSFQCSAEIYFYDVENMRCHEMSCEDVVKRLLPDADSNDTRVTCMCQVLDVLWVGTGSGHILVYHFDVTSYQLIYITCFQPYRIEVRKLCAIRLDQPNDDGVQDFVLTSGKILNEHVFGENSLCQLHGDFPLDQTFIDRGMGKGRVSPSGITMSDTHDREGKVILIWQALNSRVMKNLQI